MNVGNLNKSIKAIATSGAKRVEQIQEAAVACLEQCADHGNTTYLNQLYLACRKGERDALGRWALKFGNVKANLKKDTKATAPFAYAADKQADVAGAAACLWESYQKEPTSIERLTDESKAVDNLIGKLIADAAKFKDPAKAAAMGAALRAAMDQFRIAEQAPAESAEA